jgi:type IV pilus assembly protein PilB
MTTNLQLALRRLDPAARKLVPIELARKYRVLPLYTVGSCLMVAMENPGDLEAIDALRFRTGRSIEPIAWSAWVKEQL